MPTILVLGAGVMGTALTIPLADNGHAVRLVGTHLDGDIIEEIHESRIHPRLKVKVPDSVRPYTCDRLGEAMQGVDTLVLAVSSPGIGWAAGVLAPWLSPGLPVVFLTKGLAADGRRLYLLPDAFRDQLPAAYRAGVPLAAVGGPSIAGELAVRRHTHVVLAGSDPALLERIAGQWRTPYYHLSISTDLAGVEVCVALKNLYALAVGMVQGWLETTHAAVNEAAMVNPASALFAQGLAEMAYLARYMGGRPESAYGLPGAGDFYATCQNGRNSRMGRLLGLGLGYRQAKARHMPGETVEGAELALAIGPTLEALIRRGELEDAALPLLRALLAAVCYETPPALPWDEFFSRRSLF
jgi:glycerol-3-phosphate dehydrogenase (NAD(P)+)